MSGAGGAVTYYYGHLVTSSPIVSLQWVLPLHLPTGNSGTFYPSQFDYH